MAGHSEWANIKRRKEAQDGKKAKIFTKVVRMIEVSARNGADPDMNSALRNAIVAARKIGVPKNKIEQAIAKGSGADGCNACYDTVKYECKHGGSGISFIVNTATDNRNRTGSEIKSLLTKRGGTLLSPGSLTFMFDNVGKIQYEKSKVDANRLLEKAMDLDVIDIDEDDDFVYIYTAVSDYDKVSTALEKEFGESSSESRLMLKAKEMIDASETELIKFFALVEALEDLDDVQNVDANYPL